jgi:hypothetical protein
MADIGADRHLVDAPVKGVDYHPVVDGEPFLVKPVTLLSEHLTLSSLSAEEKDHVEKGLAGWLKPR